ncbi:MAG: family 20 glycosylhydrolase, partial [Rhizomicrobium sp.]|nr:family 20 glycosylhydrolase [Rhizomicrobium sp.]
MVIAARLLAATVVSWSLCLAAGATTPSLIPLPAHLQMGEGVFALSPQTSLRCADPNDRACAQTVKYLAALLQRDPGLVLQSDNDAGAAAIVLRRTKELAGEAYHLQVAPSGIEIEAGSDAGLFYGAITLWQLSSQQPASSGRRQITALDIADAPRFFWRGVMLDSVRHFQKPDAIKELLDAMALHKLNVLQWHLTDDQGWRIEIKKYPRLTKIGAWRKNRREGRYGGFYTQAQIREIVAYAAARHITVVPEIEMPGHASAAIAAYPRLGSIKHPWRKVSGDWGVFPNPYNVDDRTFGFLQDVLTEVMALFPSPYIHVGGDEAPKGQWDASPTVQKRMAALGVANSKALQGYFTARIGRFLEAHGRRLIGWDEILEGSPPQSATITSWHTVESASEAAEKGHDVVLSPAPQLYLDHCQLERLGEPTCRGGEETLRDIYAFDPAPSGALAAHLIGMQANIWTEHLPTAAAAFYAAFPRLAAFAEIAWSPRETHSWPDFVTRLPAQLVRYNALGITHSEAAYAVNISAVPQAGGAIVTLSNQANFGTIHFTQDGTAPIPSSPVYAAPLQIPLPATITAAAFDGEQRLS